MRSLHLLLGVLVAAGTLAAPATADSGPGIVGAEATVTESLQTFWTPERIARARSRELPAAEQSAAPARPAEPAGRELTVPGSAPAGGPQKGFLANPMVGLILGENAQGLFACSASAVGGPGRNVIATAAHCVHEGPGGTWARNLVYLPYYNYGPDPYYGTWTVVGTYVYSPWIESRDYTYDYAFASVLPRDGRVLGDVTGWNGMSFNRTGVYTAALWGYPAIPPSEGEWQYNCATTVIASVFKRLQAGGDCATLAAPGSSGGPWMYDYQQSRGWGYVTSVNSQGARGQYVLGPFFGDAARRLWEHAGAHGATLS
ncbi:trypsin-like serine peptidase [Herbidospora yilanensis]|uniref:trypsin-like serine peptidase n=1 Tax=Herbidospora yilanensis TaxID=354426 RepID=UPI0007863343|nr:hypothetical protein [Herbidospora yilanensis]